MGAEIGKCRSCEADIRWAINAKSGKGNPLNPDPVPDGNLVQNGTAEDGRMIVRALHKGEQVPALTPRYLSHFATCPNAEQHRRS